MEKGKADDELNEEEDIGDEEEEKAKNWLELKAVKLSSWKNLQTEDVHQRATARTASPGHPHLGARLRPRLPARPCGPSPRMPRRI